MLSMNLLNFTAEQILVRKRIALLTMLVFAALC